MATVTGVCSSKPSVAFCPKAQNILLQKAYVKPPRGNGYIAGTFPSGLTQVNGVPTAATVRVLHRPLSGGFADGVVVAEVESAPDGTYLVESVSATTDGISAVEVQVAVRPDAVMRTLLPPGLSEVQALGMVVRCAMATMAGSVVYSVTPMKRLRSGR